MPSLLSVCTGTRVGKLRRDDVFHWDGIVPVGGIVDTLKQVADIGRFVVRRDFAFWDKRLPTHDVCIIPFCVVILVL